MSPTARLTCRLCGHAHRAVALQPGEKARCVRCDTVLAKRSRFGNQTALVFSFTGLILAVPAAVLPFVTAGKFGNERTSLLLTGVGSLWGDGMRAMALLVLLCGAVLPLALLATLAILHAPARLGSRRTDFRFLFRAAHVAEHWAIPEVQVLAVLVAFIKLGSLVNVAVGPGFWFYGGAAFSLVIAVHNFDLDPAPRIPAAGGSGAPASP